ncbi:MAG: hypothetical protein WC505_06425 [Patescibacteria group bacterium]
MLGNDKRYSLEPEPETKIRSRSLLSVIVTGAVLLGIVGAGFAFYFSNFSVSVIGTDADGQPAAGNETLPQTVSEIAESEGFFDPDRIAFASPPDSDEDKLLDEVEAWFGTSTDSQDSDEDGTSDYFEINACTNPNGEGDVTEEQFVSYCAAFLESYEFTYEGGLEEPCAVWWPLAERAIDAHLRGDDPREVISTYDAAFNALCEQSAEFASEGFDLDSVCYVLSNAAFNICDVERLNLYFDQLGL